ncbi:hypothetical protein [Pseudomonas nitroreducens]|uniref:hypothetical protein n=1 Tax=Pseudomonas nitroreducens TaxID=46680 RepID=UPI003D26DE84
MERYHKTAGDPPRRDIDAKRQEAEKLGSLVEQFLANGGKIEEVGFKMRDKPPTGIVINPMTTPVYNGALAAERAVKAKPYTPRVVEAVAIVAAPPQKVEPAPTPQPVAPCLDRTEWLVGMIRAHAVVAEQISKLARESGISDTELRRLARRHGVGVMFYGAR